VFHFHVRVVPRFRDQPAKDAIGFPWITAPGNPDGIQRIGRQLS
jgi:histidine triad (HIT) family protein